MQIENYEPSRRDLLRSAAFAKTPAGIELHKSTRNMAYKALEWRIKNEGYVPSPETMKDYEAWLAERKSEKTAK